MVPSVVAVTAVLLITAAATTACLTARAAAGSQLASMLLLMLWTAVSQQLLHQPTKSLQLSQVRTACKITLLTAASLLVSIAAETIVSCKPAAATPTTTYSVTVDIPLP